MKILVTTPTGRIGRRVLRELLSPEFSVRVIARDPLRLPEEVREQVEVIQGSHSDPEVLREALDGVESLFWCVPSESCQETDIRGHYERFAHAASHAIRQAGTARVVTISAVGKGRARNAGPISALHAAEEILNQSGAALRHLRCGAFMENFQWQFEAICERGILSYPMPGYIAIPQVAVGDVAENALQWLVQRHWTGTQSLPVHGPDDLSYGEAAAIMGRVLERPVRYEQVTTEVFLQQMTGFGASMEFARSLSDMFNELAQGITRAEPRTPESTTPTTLAKWVETDFLTQGEICCS